MKSPIILFVALWMLVKPLWPVAEYIMNYDYIANVLCENKDKPELHCDGTCYLAKQLAKESEQNSQNPFSEKQSKAEIQLVFFQPFSNFVLAVNLRAVRQDNFKMDQIFVAVLHSSDIYRPPEMA